MQSKQMTISDLLQDKASKTKEKVLTIGGWLVEGSVTADELMALAETSKDAAKATCIEALEWATRLQPAIADRNVFDFMTNALAETAPRIKWESAKVVAHIAHLFPDSVDRAVDHLLVNARSAGTVVRWASAAALGAILPIQKKGSNGLLAAMETLCEQETDNGVRKKYIAAIKKHKA
ncbi:MAG: hypothetical protein JWP27_2994 [Flaviaesturariibacter sp.]|nr:hypothetical protein [Flaviaesturariibacter sp.]